MRERAARLLALNKLAEVFDAKFADARQAVFMEALAMVHTQNLIWACNQAAKECEFFPVPARIIEIAKRAPKLPQLSDLKKTALPEFTEQQHEDAAKKLDEILNGLNQWGTVA
jgi:hypothetical protein